jgi:hypothetical protein
MDLPRRPSPPPRGTGLERAHGTLREALAALRNLSNLVRSRKVGPRAILDLVPDVRSACGPLAQVVPEALSLLEPHLEPAALTELRAFLLERGALLARELAVAEDGSMSAKQRLHLEQVLAESWRDLSGSRALLSLLESSVYEQDMPSELRELMLQSYSGPPSAGQVHSLIPAHLHGDGVEVSVNQPRTMAALLAWGVEVVAEREGNPQITLTGGADAWTASISLRERVQGIPLTIWGYGAVAPALPCLRVAARRIGLSAAWDPEAWTLTIAGRS